MKVTPSQSAKVQEIVFAKRGRWHLGDQVVENECKPYLFISSMLNLAWDTDIEVYSSDDAEEVSADLFIRTNGTCEETESDEEIKNHFEKKEQEMSKTITIDGVEYNLVPVVPEPKKWEPKGGNYYINGNIVCTSVTSTSYREAGLEYQTEEHAKKALRIMTRRNRLLAWISENGGFYHDADWGVYFDPYYNKYLNCQFDETPDITQILMTEEQADELCRLLNSGLIEL
jgi:hypothetical protein